MSHTSIPDKVKLRLWVAAGGRCQYPGCNKPLYCDDLTLAAMNSSNVAHIIEGKATRDGWRTRLSKLDFKKIAKRYSLRFEARTDVSEPYDVYWQIVNTGDEAEARGQLRGSIFKGEKVRNEATEYTGFHWVECFIVKNGVLVARSGEFIVNIE